MSEQNWTCAACGAPLTPYRKHPPPLTESDVRRIVREEREKKVGDPCPVCKETGTFFQSGYSMELDGSWHKRTYSKCASCGNEWGFTRTDVRSKEPPK